MKLGSLVQLVVAATALLCAGARTQAYYLETFETIGGTSIGDSLMNYSPDTLNWWVEDNPLRATGNGGGLGLGANRGGGNVVNFYSAYAYPLKEGSGGAFCGNLVSKYGSNFVIRFDAQVNFIVGSTATVQLAVLSSLPAYSGGGNQTHWRYTNEVLQWTVADTGVWKTLEVPIDLTDPNMTTLGYVPPGWDVLFSNGAGLSYFTSFTRYKVGFDAGNTTMLQIMGPPSADSSGIHVVIDNFVIEPIPEPSAMLLLLAGALAWGRRWFRRNG